MSQELAFRQMINYSYDLLANGSAIDAVVHLYENSYWLHGWFWFLMYFAVVAAVFIRTESKGLTVIIALVGLSTFGAELLIPQFHFLIYVIPVMSLAMLLFVAFYKKD